MQIKLIFCQKKHICKNLFYIVTFVLQFFRVVSYWKVIKHQRPCKYTLVLQTPYFSPKYFGKRLGIILTWILIARDYFFFIFQRSTFNLEKNKRICCRKLFVHPIQVTRYTYCEIVFQTIQTGKILFVSVLSIMLICQFLNFTAVFTMKNFKFSKVCIQFPVRETHITIHTFIAFEEHY